MKLNEATNKNFKQMVVNGPRPSVVVFSSPGCHLCAGLKPILEELASDYKNQLLFYSVDVTKELKLSHTFLEEDDGVPTVFIFKDRQYKKLDEPEETDPVSWYTKDYLAENFDKYTHKRR